MATSKLKSPLTDKQYTAKVNNVVENLIDILDHNNIRLVSTDFLYLKDKSSGEILISFSFMANVNDKKYKSYKYQFHGPLHNYYQLSI